MSDDLIERSQPSTCPACGEAVPREAAVAGNFSLLECPQCGEQFFAADATDFEDDGSVADDDARRELEERRRARLDDEKHAAATQQLSDRRIRLISMERRALFRSRSWAVIAAGVCVVGAGQALLYVLSDLRHHNIRQSTLLFALGIPLALVGTWFFYTKAARFHALARQTHLDTPQQPPDFSALSDGSQHVQNLEAMGEENE